MNQQGIWPTFHSSRGALLTMLLACAGAAGCDGDNNNDAGADRVNTDATGDRRDTSTTDTGTDAGTDVVTTDATDSGNPTDASDGGTCSTAAVDPAQFFYVNDLVWVYQEDQTMLGGSATGSFGNARIRGAAATPTRTAGDCAFYAAGRFGSSARNDAKDTNIGAVTITQGSITGTYNWNESTMVYGGNVATLTGFVPGTDVTVTFPGSTGDGGTIPAGSAALAFPAQATATTFSSSLPNFSLSQDTTITWTPPAGAPADTATFFWVYDQTAQANMIVCAVPACRGRLVVPASLKSEYNTASSLNPQILFARSTTVTGTNVRFAVGSGVAYAGINTD